MQKSKKITTTILSIILCSIFLCGCIRIDFGIKINKNGTCDLNILMAAMSQGENTNDSDTSDTETGLTSSALSDPEDIQKYKDAGYEVEDYTDGKYQGVILHKKEVPISDIKQELMSIFNKEDTASIEGNDMFAYGKQGNEYVINWKNARDWNSSGSSGSTENQSGDASDMFSNFDASGMIKGYGGYATITLELPTKAIDSNADEISEDGKTLKWDLLTTNENKDIYVKFKAGGPDLDLIACIGLWVLAAAIWIIALIRIIGAIREG